MKRVFTPSLLSHERIALALPNLTKFLGSANISIYEYMQRPKGGL